MNAKRVKLFKRLNKRSIFDEGRFLIPHLKEIDHLLDCGCARGSIKPKVRVGKNLIVHFSSLGTNLSYIKVHIALYNCMQYHQKKNSFR